MTISNKKIKIISVIIIIAFIFLFGFLYFSSAQSTNIFGGMVLTSEFCTCSENFLLMIGPPVSGQFIFEIGTSQYANYRLPSTGVWTLGLYDPGGECLMLVGKYCESEGAPEGTISSTVGTSN